MTGNAPTETEDLIVEVTDRDFEREVERSASPTVVMFYSDACPHCRTILPAVRGFARELRGRVRFLAMNVAANPWTVERYGVRATPTLAFFCRGQNVQDLVGALESETIRRLLTEFEVHGEECVRRSTEIDYEVTGYA